MSRPTPEELISDWQRRKAVKAAERAVVEAAEKWVLALAWDEAATTPRDWVDFQVTEDDLIKAVSKLREAREN